MSLKSVLMTDNTTMNNGTQAGRLGVKNGKISQYLQSATKVPLRGRRSTVLLPVVDTGVSQVDRSVSQWTQFPPPVPPSVSNSSSTQTLPSCPFNGTRHASCLLLFFLWCFQN